MSPKISMVSFMEPIQSADVIGEGGTTSATDLPKRVTRIGFLVFCTCSSSARHLALNSEMATSFISGPINHTIVNFSGQLSAAGNKQFGNIRHQITQSPGLR